MRTAKSRAGAEGREVVQDFDICFPAPREGAMAKLADMLEEVTREAGSSYLNDPFMLNDVAVQHYHPNSKELAFTVMLSVIAGLCSLSHLPEESTLLFVKTVRAMERKLLKRYTRTHRYFVSGRFQWS